MGSRVSGRWIACLALCAGLAFRALAASPAGSYDYDAGPCAEAGLSVAKFRLHVSEAKKPPRGILVLLGGRNSDARGRCDQPEWRLAAKEDGLALMACFLKGPEADHETYQLDERGATARHINGALIAVAAIAGRPEIAGLPLAFWGVSAGGNVSAAYAGHFPERTLSVVTIVAPNGHGRPNRKKIKVPILAVIGKNDRPAWLSYAMECYESARDADAPWTLALHARRGHDGAGSDGLARTFLHATVTQRLMGSSEKSPKLMPVDVTGGWLGDLQSYDIHPHALFTGDKKNATWLPDRATAEAWRAYLTSP